MIPSLMEDTKGINMSAMEIVLIILGIIVFVISFLIPSAKQEEVNVDSKGGEEALREMAEKEVAEARTKISEIVDETVSYAMEKSERSMERLTNEKIMAVNDYSDTVLQEINKNHKEVVFLYDMLNDKHENLKGVVSEASKTASQIKKTLEEAEDAVQRKAQPAAEAVKKPKETSQPASENAGTLSGGEGEFKPISPERVELLQASSMEDVPVETEAPKKAARKPRKTKAAKGEAAEKEEAQPKAPKVEVSLDAAGKRNNNEKILELHKAGKSNMAIAKELGLGIGEVKLVIDLFEGI